MPCKAQARDLLDQYVAGTLDAEAVDQFEVHLLDCATCLTDVEALQQMRETLSDHAHEIRTRPTRPHRFVFRYWIPALAALAFVVVVAGRFMVRKQSPATVKIANQSTEQPHPAPAAAEQTPTPPVKPTIPNAAAVASAPIQRPPRVEQPQTISEQKKTGEAGVAEAEQPMRRQAENPVPASEPAKVAEAKAPAKNRGLTNDQAVELFRLGVVIPPPYVAVGVAANEKAQSSSARNGVVASDANESGASLYEQAMIHYVDKDYVHAVELLQAASNALGPVRAPEVDYYLGVCQLLNGHPQHAVAPLQRVAAVNKSRLVPAAHLYLAKAYLQQGKLNEAQMHLELATTRPGALKSEATALLARLKLLRQSMEESGTTPVP